MVSSGENKLKQKELAKESKKTQKTRKKLEGRLQDMEQQFSKEALKQKKVEMHRWLRRHEGQRIPLNKKNVALFDENQNAAAISVRVRQMAEKLLFDIPSE